MTASPYINPEQRARQKIDVQLAASGWLIQDYRQFNPLAGKGIAVREAPLTSVPLRRCAPTAVDERSHRGTVSPPFIDGSCRREPDFENSLPSISALCGGAKFAPMLFPGDPVAYITKQGRYGGEVGWRLVALLRIVAPFETHEAAAAAYRAGSVPVPNNCLVPGNDPVAYGLTHGVAPRETLERADPSIQPDRVIGLWDRSYAQRAAKYGTQLMCEAEFLELRQPPLLLRADLVRIFGGIPPTLNPPPIAAEQYAALAAFPVRLPADRA